MTMMGLEIDNADRSEAEEAFGCQVKMCRRCKEWLPSDGEFFPSDAGSSDGWNKWCKACWSEYGEARRLAR